jgi:hypothetical protein
VSLGCGMAMFLITEFGATTLLQAFVGVNNAALVPAARTYVQVAVILPSCICNAENASQVDYCSF